MLHSVTCHTQKIQIDFKHITARDTSECKLSIGIYGALLPTQHYSAETQCSKTLPRPCDPLCQAQIVVYGLEKKIKGSIVYLFMPM